MTFASYSCRRSSLRSVRARLKPFKHPYVVDGVPFEKGQMPPVGGGDAPGQARTSMLAENVGVALRVNMDVR